VLYNPRRLQTHHKRNAYKSSETKRRNGLLFYLFKSSTMRQKQHVGTICFTAGPFLSFMLQASRLRRHRSYNTGFDTLNQVLNILTKVLDKSPGPGDIQCLLRKVSK
jgi:hypothetical protein